jgi:hypothetical protein
MAPHRLDMDAIGGGDLRLGQSPCVVSCDQASQFGGARTGLGFGRVGFSGSALRGIKSQLDLSLRGQRHGAVREQRIDQSVGGGVRLEQLVPQRQHPAHGFPGY